MLRLHDTALGRVVEIEPRRAGHFSMYVCGPTVYGPPHIGHGRLTLVFDLLRRYLEFEGVEVHHVSNITDIDDQIIERGQREDRDPAEIAVRCEAAWYDAMDGLGVLRPHDDPHATAYVAPMVDLVSQLVDLGLAYETSDGVYLAVEKVESYGLLARQSLDDLRSGARVEVSEEKRSPLDFALWKKAKPGEPTWDSPWGPGRPGWHTECVVMSLDLLGEGFDLHGGGQDLRFPHHENERAQAVAVGKTFARHWVHNGWVEVEGTKMSKSLGNYVNLLDLLEAHDGRAYRLLVARSHYRSPLEVTKETLVDAEAALARLDAFARRVRDVPAAEADAAALAKFRERMDDDLDTPAAVALLFDLVRHSHAALDRGDPAGAAPLVAAARAIAGALGLDLRAEAGRPLEPAVQALVEARDAARAAGDYAEADRIRDELTGKGWQVEDTTGGTQVRRA